MNEMHELKMHGQEPEAWHQKNPNSHQPVAGLCGRGLIVHSVGSIRHLAKLTILLTLASAEHSRYLVGAHSIVLQPVALYGSSALTDATNHS